MRDTIRVIQYGLGPIGSRVARHVVERAGLELVGGVDVDPSKVGKDIAEVIGSSEPRGVAVTENLAQTLARSKADVVLHTTSSYFNSFRAQILEILEAGLDIVSTAEELAFPWLAHPAAAAEIDVAAKRAGRTVLGTGVNPGFLMDALPLFVTAICQQVDRIEVTRVINASTRRRPFQAKIGSGLTVEEFQTRMDAGRMGHVGLPESLGMVCHTLGRELSHLESEVEPLLAAAALETDSFTVEPGQVRGLKQVARGYTDQGLFITLTFVAGLELDDEGDTIKITGKPDLEVSLQGTNGDIATAAIAVNAIPRVQAAAPGLVTMCDLPMVTLW